MITIKLCDLELNNCGDSIAISLPNGTHLEIERVSNGLYVSHYELNNDCLFTMPVNLD